MEPAAIVFIRHAEKGDEPVDLSERGYERSRELVRYFGKTRPETVPRPNVLCAMEQHRPDESSDRCVETLLPFARGTCAHIHTFPKKNTDVIVDFIREQRDDTVLVCGNHDFVVNVVRRFGVSVNYWGNHPTEHYEKYDFSSLWVLHKEGDSSDLVFRVYPTFEFDEEGRIRYDEHYETPIYSQFVRGDQETKNNKGCCCS